MGNIKSISNVYRPKTSVDYRCGTIHTFLLCKLYLKLTPYTLFSFIYVSIFQLATFVCVLLLHMFINGFITFSPIFPLLQVHLFSYNQKNINAIIIVEWFLPCTNIAIWSSNGLI